jgi:hypothetical protein
VAAGGAELIDEAEEGPRFVGRAANYDPPPPPKDLQKETERLLSEAAKALEDGNDREAEPAFREAIECLVDAFLLNRRGNAGAFTAAHQLGAFVSERFGCPMQSSDGEWWHTDCGISALHSRLGNSIAGTSRGRCSICSAEDFGCEHVPGHVYDGESCIRIVYEMSIDEVSLVPFPADPRCYRVHVLRSLSEIEASVGEPLPAGATPTCVHCQQCPGTSSGPNADDIDQALWKRAESQ